MILSWSSSLTDGRIHPNTSLNSTSLMEYIVTLDAIPKNMFSVSSVISWIAPMTSSRIFGDAGRTWESLTRRSERNRGGEVPRKWSEFTKYRKSRFPGEVDVEEDGDSREIHAEEIFFKIVAVTSVRKLFLDDACLPNVARVWWKCSERSREDVRQAGTLPRPPHSWNFRRLSRGHVRAYSLYPFILTR